MLHRPRHRAQFPLGWLLVATLLAGCAPGALDRTAQQLEVRTAEAQRLEGDRQWQAAAEAWQGAAELARGADRDQALVAGAEAWLRAGEPLNASAALAGVSADPGPELRARRALAEATIALRAGRPADALRALEGVPVGPGDPEAARLLALRADAAFANRMPVLGTAALMRRESLLATPEERLANQRRLWNRMQEATAAGISLETPPGTDRNVAAWLELGRLAAASEGNLFRLRAGLLDWRARHPVHPASAGLVETLLTEYRAMTEFPRRVALILPLSGRQAAAAAAVRDGFIAAYLAHDAQNQRPVLSIYDSSALGPSAAFELAARNGAEFIVGPLLKEELAELSGAELPAVPGLALNWADDGVVLPDHLYQFALAPEEEAAAVARRAALDGHARAVVLVHGTDQGRRMAQSFSAAFEAAGGQTLGTQFFDPIERDFSIEITRLMLLDESRARHQRLQSILGRRLEFEPRRRQDVDFLFLAARPGEALLIRPQLQFHYAGQLPVYATSSIFDPARGASPDLDGIMFADMPWRVGAGDTAFMNQFQSFGPAALERSGRLYAFGADAYRLVPLLHNRSPQLAGGVNGLTGELRVGPDGRVQRELAWGRFQQGSVQPAPLPELSREPGSQLR
jgi:uncharacterized protein